MSQTTPKKPTSRRGRKPKEATASDSCRLCGCCFKTQFGNFKTGWITSENIFTAPQRKGKTLPMLAEVSEPICPFTLKKRARFLQ